MRKAYVKQGLEVALQRKKPAREYEHVLDGEGEAYLIAMACSEPPTGPERWSLRLLQQRFVKLGYTDNILYETIRRVLKKTNSSRGCEGGVVYPAAGQRRLCVSNGRCVGDVQAAL